MAHINFKHALFHFWHYQSKVLWQVLLKYKEISNYSLIFHCCWLSITLSQQTIDKKYLAVLSSHPQHTLAIKQLKGFSGMVSFYLKGDPIKFLKAVKIFTSAGSLGSPESLVEIP